MKNRSQGIGVRTRGKASVAVQNDRQGAVCQNSQCPADFVRKHKEALRMMLSGSARKPSEGSQETHRKLYTHAHRRFLCIANALHILAHTLTFVSPGQHIHMSGRTSHTHSTTGSPPDGSQHVAAHAPQSIQVYVETLAHEAPPSHPLCPAQAHCAEHTLSLTLTGNPSRRPHRDPLC